MDPGWRYLGVISKHEATSSLDPQTEAAVERADRVALMESGRLVEVASRAELVARGDR